MVRFYFTLILSKLIIKLEALFETLTLKLHLFHSRNEAYRLINKVVRKNGKPVVSKHIRKSIKKYAKQKFGTTAYWPYLALYTEIRGHFIEGWLPYDYYEFVLMPELNPKKCGYLSDQKTYDYRLFNEFAIEPLFVFISGMFFNANLEKIESSVVSKNLNTYENTIVVKEENGMGGKQVKIMNSAEFIPESLCRNKNYIIQPFIKQYKILSELYPHSVNTFRVTTYLKTDGSIDIKLVILRFGVDGSMIDNLSSGGQYLYFDASGKPSRVAFDYELGFEIGDRHQNTGFLFSSLSIPMFPKILEKCKEAHKKYLYIKLIGWDVCIDSFGEPRLIEWNAFNPVFWPMEAKFGPLWKDNNEII